MTVQVLIARLLTLAGVAYTDTQLTSLCKHSDGSIPFLKYVLAAYRVDTLAVDLTEEQLEEIPLPALALLDLGQGRNKWVVLEKIQGASFYIFAQKNSEAVSRKEFCHSWTGKALLIEKTEQSGEPQLKENRHKDKSNKRNTFLRKSFFCLFIFLLCARSCFLFVGNWSALAFFVLSLFGVALSALLLLGENLPKNNFFRNACTALGNKHCGEIVKNRTLFLASRYTWAEAAFAFFIFFVLSFVFSPDALSTNVVYPLAQLLSLLGIPVGFYSLYIQGFKQKKMCLFCLGIVAVLFAYTMPFLYADTTFFVAQTFLSASVPLLLSGLSTYLVLCTIALYFAERQLNVYSHTRLTAFLHAQDAFLFALKSSPAIDQNAAPADFLYGNTESDFNIVMISRPSCAPCQTAHRTVEEMLKNFGGLFSLRICYAFSSDASDPNRQFVEKELGKNGLDKFQTENALEKHHAFYQVANITHTPAFIVNGHILPPSYRLEDLMFFAVNQ